MNCMSMFHIKDDFIRLSYSGITITLLTKNYFVNISKLLSVKNKDFREFLNYSYIKELISILEKTRVELGTAYGDKPYGADASNIVIEIASDNSGDNNAVAGYYIHKQLLPHIPCLSPALTIKVSQMIDAYISNSVSKTIEVTERVNRRLLRLVDTTSEKHAKEFYELKTTYNKNLSTLRSSLNAIKEVNERITETILGIESIVNYKPRSEMIQLIILQSKDTVTLFRFLIGEESTMIQRLYKFKKSFRIFFRTSGVTISSIVQLLERLVEENCISMHRLGFRLLSNYQIRDLSRDLSEVKYDEHDGSIILTSSTPNV